VTAPATRWYSRFIASASLRSVLAFAVAACAVSFGAGWMARDVVHSDADGPADAPATTSSECATAEPTRAEESKNAAPDTRGGTSGPTRAGSSRSSRPTTVADFEARLTSAWDAAHADAQRPTAAEFEYAAQVSRDDTARDLDYAAGAADARMKQQLGSLESWMALQSQRGVADDGPVTVELRARGREHIAGDARPGKLARLAFDPLDAGTRDSDGEGVVGPVPRLGRLVVVERVEIDARLGRGSTEKGSIEVRWPGGSQEWKGRSDHIRAVFEGSSLSAYPRDLKLDVTDAVARVRFVGRIVGPDAAPASRPFVQSAEESAGFLRDGAPVRVQIVTDGGYGMVDLTGATDGRIEDAPGRPVWDENATREKLRRSSYWTENAGLVPLGFAFRVTRIEWRARLLGGEKNCRLDVKAPGGEERLDIAVEPSRDAPKGQFELLAGTWNGDALIRKGEDLRITCTYYGMADVTVFGRLERVDR
jgi:hypothetical protein